MSTDDRRAFLKKLASGVAYSAPVIASFAAPAELVGQGTSSQHKPGASAGASGTGTGNNIGGPPPWQQPSPGAGGAPGATNAPRP